MFIVFTYNTQVETYGILRFKKTGEVQGGGSGEIYLIRCVVSVEKENTKLLLVSLMLSYTEKTSTSP